MEEYDWKCEKTVDISIGQSYKKAKNFPKVFLPPQNVIERIFQNRFQLYSIFSFNFQAEQG